MSQCVPDWDADRSGGGGGGGGGCSPAIPGSTDDLVPRDQWRHADNDPFSGTADDFWPWWDWDLDDVAELKWADGQPRVVLQNGAATSKTPTPTPPAILTPPDADDDLDLDLDLDRYRCLWAEGHHPADAIVPGSTAPVPAAAAADAADSTSCSVLVPDVTTAPAQQAANSISLAGAARKRPPPPPPPPPKAGEAIMGGVKRQRRHLQEKGRRHDDNPAGICSASAPHKARCRSALSERKRRDKFNQKIQTLQKLLPNCAKVDKVSILDEVITHVRQLQAQTQMHIMTAAASTAGLPSVSQVQPPIMNMMPPPATPMAAYMHQQFQIMAQMAAQMSQMLRSMGLAGTNGFFPHPPPTSHLINLISSSHPTLIPIAEQPGMAPSGSRSSRSNRQAFAASFAPPPTK